jgi:hypothetical protein
MLHTKVVPHLMGNRGSNKAYHFTVVHAHTTWELKRADGAFQSFANNAAFKQHSPAKGQK